MKCHACLVEKDMSKLEAYPHAAEDGLVDTPIEPLLEMHVQPVLTEGPWRLVLLCHDCFHRVHPDMWISDRCLQSIGCKTPMADLPLLDEHLNKGTT